VCQAPARLLCRNHRAGSGALNRQGGLLSNAEANYSSDCCAAFGPGSSLKGGRTFLANGRNKYFAISARDSISRPFDVTQGARLPRLTLGAWRSRRTGRTWFAALSCHALWAGRSLLPSTSLGTSRSWRSWRTLRTGWPLRTGCALWSSGTCSALAAFTSGQQDGDEQCHNDAQSTHGRSKRLRNFDLTLSGRARRAHRIRVRLGIILVASFWRMPPLQSCAAPHIRDLVCGLRDVRARASTSTAFRRMRRLPWSVALRTSS